MLAAGEIMLDGKLKKLWRQEPPVRGLELLVDCLLLVLRSVSISYWIRAPFERKSNVRWRNNLIDLYCICQLLLLAALLIWSDHFILNTCLSIYVLFEIYLTVFNIVFLRKFPDINYPPPSPERVILLMLLNVVQVLSAYAVMYRAWSFTPITWRHAVSEAVQVLGTISVPPQRAILADSQILLDLLLLVIFLANFVSQVGADRRTRGSESVAGAPAPPEVR
jgi:hypothetical protein